MNLFGLKLEEIELLKSKIQEVFGEKTDLKVFLFGSRATKKNRKNSDIDLAFKSKDPQLDSKISILKNELEDSSIPYKVDLVNWDSLFKEYLPEINKHKIPFWDRKQVIVRSPWRVCPLGEHWVRRHPKKVPSGKLTDHDGHCRKNRSGKDVLRAEEVKKISTFDIFINTKIKASQTDMGFGGRDLLYDHLINGWCAYWNEMLKPEVPIHPNIVKALIATESSFRPTPKRDKKHRAIGIAQLMPTTIRLLSTRGGELKDHFLEITKAEALDPSVNICAAVRWLFRKFELSKRRDKKTDWLKVLEEYKGVSDQKGPVSDKIRARIRSEYSKLEPQ